MVRPVNPWLVVGVVAAACWSSWRWYAARVAATPDEALALVMTVALIIGVGIGARSSRTLERVPIGNAAMTVLSLLLLTYALAHAVAPPIILAAIAVTTVLYALYVALVGANPPIAFFGLVALSLPVLPSLQFVFGYPLRIASASMTVALLQLQGLAVQREGATMLFRGETIQFDAPCSGINMAWAGLMLTLAACVVWRAGWRMTAIAVVLSLGLAIAANVLRAVSLFYVEAGLIAGAPEWWHEAIGLAAFAIAGGATIAVLAHLRTMEATWAR